MSSLKNWKKFKKLYCNDDDEAASQCVGCDFYERYLKTGTYIGDAPCERCNKYCGPRVVR